MARGFDTTVEATLARASAAYATLAELGEEVDEEWSYVQDLSAAWLARLEDVRGERGEEVLDPAVVQAIESAIAEAGRIVDQHRAIDWLSTFPQVILLALGEGP